MLKLSKEELAAFKRSGWKPISISEEFGSTCIVLKRTYPGLEYLETVYVYDGAGMTLADAIFQLSQEVFERSVRSAQELDDLAFELDKLCKSEGSEMKVYTLPTYWEMYSHVNVQAKTLREAYEKVLASDFPLPRGEYVEGTFHIDPEGGAFAKPVVANSTHKVEAKPESPCEDFCEECGTPSCAYYDSGLCKFPLVKGRKPNITEEEGCLDGVYDIF